MRWLITIVLAGLLLFSSQSRADDLTPDKFGLDMQATTQLGKRIVPLSKRWTSVLMPTWNWNKIRAVIESSDAEADARADVNSKKVGFMVLESRYLGYKRFSPGLKCSQDVLRKKAVFVLSLNDAPTKQQRETQNAFATYAEAYNLHMFKVGLIKDTSCQVGSGRRR